MPHFPHHRYKKNNTYSYFASTYWKKKASNIQQVRAVRWSVHRMFIKSECPSSFESTERYIYVYILIINAKRPHFYPYRMECTRSYRTHHLRPLEYSNDCWRGAISNASLNSFSYDVSVFLMGFMHGKVVRICIWLNVGTYPSKSWKRRSQTAQRSSPFSSSSSSSRSSSTVPLCWDPEIDKIL